MSSIYQPYDYENSIERTSHWAEHKAHRRPHDQGLFGIAQEQVLEDLRTSAQDLVSMDFPGYSIEVLQ